MSKSNLCTHGPYTWSYDTVIKQVLPGGITLGNVTWYTWTTYRHQMQSGCRQCEVQLDNVPKGILDLLPLAVERGIIPTDSPFYVPGSSMLYQIVVKEPARIIDVIAKYPG